MNRNNTAKRKNVKGSSLTINLKKEIFHLCHKKRFWGFPIGVRLEPTLTDIASNITNFEISLRINFWRLKVIGMTINNAISFVRNVESIAESITKKISEAALCFAFSEFLAQKSKNIRFLSGLWL